MRFYKYLPAILAAVALCAVSGEASAENTPADITSISEADTNNSGEDEILLSGWVQDLDGKTFYYTEDGTLTKGIAEIDGDTYYFAPNGVMKTGWFTIDGKRVFFDFNTGKRMDGWINYLDGIFYSDPQYGKLTGKQTINNNTYYFNENGKLYTDWFVLDGVKYYGGSDGAIRTGESEIDGITYHFSPTGRFESGWQSLSMDGYIIMVLFTMPMKQLGNLQVTILLKTIFIGLLIADIWQPDFKNLRTAQGSIIPMELLLKDL